MGTYRRRRDEERRSLIALVVEHARARSDPEEDLHLRTVTPGLLAKHTTGRGTSKQRQCWAIDAATLQVPDGWGEAAPDFGTAFTDAYADFAGGEAAVLAAKAAASTDVGPVRPLRPAGPDRD